MNEPIDVHKVFAEYFKGNETLAFGLSAKLGEGNICLAIYGLFFNFRKINQNCLDLNQ
ncbi:MAG: hypothetical protein WCJ95_13965 [Mariniphaga sp.]